MPFFYFFAFMIVLSNTIRQKSSLKINEFIDNKKQLTIYVLAASIGNALWFSSLFLMGASGVALISILQRIFIMMYGIKKLNEKMTVLQYLLSGVIILSSLVFSKDSNNSEFVGIILCVLSYSFFTISDIFQKNLSNKVCWQIALTLRQCVQFIFFSLLTIIYVFYVDLDFYSFISFDMILWGFFASLLGAVFGKIAHYKAIQKTELSRVVLIEQFNSVIVFFVSAFLISANLTTVQFFSGSIMVLCLCVILITDYHHKRKI